LTLGPYFLHRPGSSGDGKRVTRDGAVADIGEFTTIVIVITPSGRIRISTLNVESNIGIGDGFDQFMRGGISLILQNGRASPAPRRAAAGIFVHDAAIDDHVCPGLERVMIGAEAAVCAGIARPVRTGESHEGRKENHVKSIAGGRRQIAGNYLLLQQGLQRGVGGGGGLVACGDGCDRISGSSGARADVLGGGVLLAQP